MDEQSVTIAQVITAVQDGVLAATLDPSFDDNLMIDHLEVTLLVANKANIGADGAPGVVAFLPLIGGGADIAEEDFTTLTLNLKYNPPELRPQDLAAWAAQLDDQIKDGILAIIRGVHNAGLFTLQQASIALKFQVTTTGKLRLFVISGGKGQGKTHSLTLHLKHNT